MWLLLKGLALRAVVGRTVGGMFLTLLLAIVPLGGMLKLVGVPLLLVLAVVGAPLFLLLALIGLPVLLVLAFGGVLLALLAGLLVLGVFAIRIVVPIVLLVWLVRWMLRDGRTGRRNEGMTGTA